MNLFFFIFLFILFILITNIYFSYSDSLIYGGSDGRYYIKISKSFPIIADDIEYIKGERFFFPYLIGGISKLFSLEVFTAYRIFVFFLFILISFFTYRILKKIKSSNLFILISLSLLIFNPFIFRFFLAIPTIINDLFFMFSTILIIHGFVYEKKKNVFLGFLISILSRQNGIFFLISFLISKFFFKEKSFFTYKDILFCIIIFIAAMFLNTTYAINANSASQVSAVELYKITIFGIFFDNYNSTQLIKFIIFPFLSYAPLMVFFYLQKNNLKKIYLTEISLIIIFSSIMIFIIAFVSGPVVTGKNIIRLANLNYPMLIILLNLYSTKVSKTVYSNFLIIIIFFITWSLHPTFSTIAVFDKLKFLFMW